MINGGTRCRSQFRRDRRGHYGDPNTASQSCSVLIEVVIVLLGELTPGLTAVSTGREGEVRVIAGFIAVRGGGS